MKLIFCPECSDVFKLRANEVKSCACGKSKGMYEEDGLHAIINEIAIPIGFANSSFANAIRNRKIKAEFGERFKAFVIPVFCNTIEVVEDL